MAIRLALVPGEPAGIGPELCVRLAQRAHTVQLVAFADPDTLLRAAARLGLPLQLLPPEAAPRRGALAIQPMALPGPEQLGHPDPAHAEVVMAALHAAVDACMDGQCQALVTGPIHKASINAGGIAYSGTTEVLARRAGTEVVMMLANPSLRVALATTHLPLRAVPDAIQPASLTRCLRILERALRCDFDIPEPRIAVLGLNPHAGEEGVLGHEEIEVITPVIEALRAEGMRLTGPLPADTAFLPDRLGEVDAVLAMYHDQGLPVLKHQGLDKAVNITLGLPYPRVAVDHGTALDLAGKGLADPSSLIAAVDLATWLGERRMGGPSGVSSRCR